MSAPGMDPRWKAGLVAFVIFALGVGAGVSADRLWLGRTAAAGPPPITVASMAEALRLDAPERARMRALVDSLQPDIARAAAQGPDSLRTATMHARQRIEDALPPDRRADFLRWLDARHARMMEHMRGMMRRGMGPGMMRRMGPGRRPGMGRPPGPGMPPAAGAPPRGGRRMGPGMGPAMMRRD